MDLLNLRLTPTYFQYYSRHYKQLHGTAMRSPVSVIVAKNCDAEHRGKRSFDFLTDNTSLQSL